MPTSPPPTESAAPNAPSHQKGRAILAIIGVFKLAKGFFLLVAVIVVLHLHHLSEEDALEPWINRIAPGHRHIHGLMARLLSVTPREFRLIAAVLSAYSAMFLTEGVGLLLAQRWAEWMTVFTTAGLLPVELFELCKKPHLWKAAALLINIAVVVYLIHRVTVDRRSKIIPTGT